MAERQVHPRVVQRAPRRRRQHLARLGRAVHPGERHAEVQGRLGVVGLELGGPLQGAERVGPAPEPEQGSPEGPVDRRVAREALDARPERLDRLFGPPGHVVERAIATASSALVGSSSAALR